MESELISIIFVRRYLRNSNKRRKGKVEICKSKYQLWFIKKELSRKNENVSGCKRTRESS